MSRLQVNVMSLWKCLPMYFLTVYILTAVSVNILRSHHKFARDAVVTSDKSGLRYRRQIVDRRVQRLGEAFFGELVDVLANFIGIE